MSTVQLPNHMSLDHLKLRIEFGGGLELLFSNQRTHDISLPSRVYPASNSPLEAKNAQDFGELDGRPADMKFLLSWLKANLLKEREELFLDGNTVFVTVPICLRPLILTLFF